MSLDALSSTQKSRIQQRTQHGTEILDAGAGLAADRPDEVDEPQCVGA